MHICDNPWVFKVNEGVVNKEMTSGRGMKDVEVSVFDPGAIEVRGGEGPSVERGRVLAIALASHSYKVSVFSNAPVTNVLSCFRLSLFIEEYDGIKVGLGPIVSHPPFARVVRILEIAGEGGGKANGLRRGHGSSNGGLVLREADWLVTVDAVLTHVWFSEIYDAGNEEEMVYRFEIAVSSFKGLVIKTVVP